MALEQVVGFDGIAVVEPALFGVVERALQEIARAVETEDCHAALLRARAGRRQMIEQKFLAKNGVDRLGERRALTGTELAVVAKNGKQPGRQDDRT